MLVLLLAILAAEPTNSSAVPADWAFRPPQRTPLPRGFETRHPIDAFLEADLRAAGVALNPPAERAVLLRRLSFDLVGLPPTPEELDAFLADRSPQAWENCVDRLLASSRYGERSARLWLDLVRYAESDGYRFDRLRPDAYRYRDYVIKSLNDDKPFDRFALEQLAGDELWPDDLEARIATGYLRLYAEEEVDAYLHSKRQNILNDVVDTTGTAFLGLTLACARCHDHKFDPLPQADYYALQAFFAGVVPTEIPRKDFPHNAEAAAQADAWEKRAAPVRTRLAGLERKAREEFRAIAWRRFPPEVIAALEKPASARSPLDRFVAALAPKQYDPPSEKLLEGLGKNAAWKSAFNDWQRFARQRPNCAGDILCVTDVGKEAPPTFVLGGGRYDRPLTETAPAFPKALGGGAPKIEPTAASSGRRTAFARWLVTGDHPLTARVVANRLWQQHFGQGLVATPADFGFEGARPSHPALLDRLATELPATGWRLKSMHRSMVTSAAYMRSSAENAPALQRDPDNRLLWRMPRRRLDAEILRDALLAAAGLLEHKLYGPSVFPPFDVGAPQPANWLPPLRPEDEYRRSIYIFARRNLPYPLLDAFDAPASATPCARRPTTDTALQALHLVNSRTTLVAARHLAGILSRQPAGAPRIELAYKRCFARTPTAAETKSALAFLRSQSDLPLSTEKPPAQPLGAAADFTPSEGAALVDFCHALLASNEFLFVD